MTSTTRSGPATTRRVAPAFGLVVTALVIVYVVWGSTYLAIRIVVEEAPPMTSMGLRYTTAALLLGALLAVAGRLEAAAPDPSPGRRAPPSWACCCRCSATAWSRWRRAWAPRQASPPC